MSVYVKGSFEETCFTLFQIHNELWFDADTGDNKLTDCDCWENAVIRSTQGRPLAHQFGHPDEWLLSALWDKPDKGLIIDEPDEDSCITQKFMSDVRFMMMMLVTPDIDDNGIFIRQDSNEEWRW